MSKAVSLCVAALMTAALGRSLAAQRSNEPRYTDKEIARLIAATVNDPDNPETHYRLAVAYWHKACVPPAKACAAEAGPPSMQRKYVQEGLTETEKTLALRLDHIEALTYKSLLLRGLAYLDPSRAGALTREADALLEFVSAIQKKRGGNAR